LTGVVTVQVLGYQNENPKDESVYSFMPATAIGAGAVGLVGLVGVTGEVVVTTG